MYIKVKGFSLSTPSLVCMYIKLTKKKMIKVNETFSKTTFIFHIVRKIENNKKEKECKKSQYQSWWTSFQVRATTETGPVSGEPWAVGDPELGRESECDTASHRCSGHHTEDMTSYIQVSLASL